MSELTKNVQPLQDFDWEQFENGTTANVSKEELDKAYDETLNKVSEHQVVDGKVISVDKKEVVVNIGYKSDGIIPASEFRYNPDLKAGDIVEVYVENAEDKKGQLVLSHKKARLSKSWDRVNAALEAQEVVNGYIKCRTKGGMIVDVFGIEAFLPGSQIDVHPIRDYDQFVDKTMEFKIVKINQEFRNVVVSHKALIEAELEAQKQEIMSKLEKGQILEGVVKNITSYGVFVDLGGVDGLIHITDLSWGRVDDPHKVVELDQKINVVILDFDEEKKRIALGLKQLTPHPWDALDADLKVGDHVKGKVVVIADYGAFVEIQPGVEGLIHVSEMSWSQHLRSAQEFLKVGDEIEAVIITLDRDERKMSLGIKQLKEDPWEAIEVKYPVGSKHTAKVRNFTNFSTSATSLGPRRLSILLSSLRLVHRSTLSFSTSTRRTVVSALATSSSRRILGMSSRSSTPLVLSTRVRSLSSWRRVPLFLLLRTLRASLLLSTCRRRMAHRLRLVRFCPSRLSSSTRTLSASSSLTAAPSRILSVRRRRLLPRRLVLRRQTLQRLRMLQPAPHLVTLMYWLS